MMFDITVVFEGGSVSFSPLTPPARHFLRDHPDVVEEPGGWWFRSLWGGDEVIADAVEAGLSLSLPTRSRA